MPYFKTHKPLLPIFNIMKWCSYLPEYEVNFFKLPILFCFVLKIINRQFLAF